MSSSAAKASPAIHSVPKQQSDPRREPFLRLSDEDRRQCFRVSNGKAQFGALLFLLRRTLSAKGSPRAAALSYTEIAEELGIDERSAMRVMSDAETRGLVERCSVDEAVRDGLMKKPRSMDPRTNAWEPLRKKWPNLPGADEIERPAREDKPAREAKPVGVTMAPGDRMKPIPIQAEDKEITARVKEGSAPISLEVYKGNGLVEVVVFSPPPSPIPTQPTGMGDTGVIEEKAKTVDNTALIVTSFLTPVFNQLYSHPINEELARRISISLADTPFALYRALVREKLKGDRSKIRPGLFVTLAEQACENYGAVILRQINAQHNGHAKEDPTTKSEFTQWCAENGVHWTNGAELFAAQDRYERETGRRAD